jgi:hypothetical protein
MRFVTRIRPALVVMLFLAGAVPAMRAQPADAQAAPVAQIKRIYGTLIAVDLVQQTVSFRKRNGKTILLDISQAQALQQVGVLPLNKPIVLWGIRGPDKLFHVQSIGHAAPTQREWGTDTETGE